MLNYFVSCASLFVFPSLPSSHLSLLPLVPWLLAWGVGQAWVSQDGKSVGLLLFDQAGQLVYLLYNPYFCQDSSLALYSFPQKNRIYSNISPGHARCGRVETMTTNSFGTRKYSSSNTKSKQSIDRYAISSVIKCAIQKSGVDFSRWLGKDHNILKMTNSLRGTKGEKAT